MSENFRIRGAESAAMEHACYWRGLACFFKAFRPKQLERLAGEDTVLTEGPEFCVERETAAKLEVDRLDHLERDAVFTQPVVLGCLHSQLQASLIDPAHAFVQAATRRRHGPREKRASSVCASNAYCSTEELLSLENATLYELRSAGVLPSTLVCMSCPKDGPGAVETRRKRRRLNELIEANNQQKALVRARAVQHIAKEEVIRAVLKADRELARAFAKAGEIHSSGAPAVGDARLAEALVSHDDALRGAFHSLGVHSQRDLHQLWERPPSPLFFPISPATDPQPGSDS
eukprot:RCo034748